MTSPRRESNDEEAFNAREHGKEDVIAGADVSFGDATKARGTVLLLLDPDERLRTEY